MSRAVSFADGTKPPAPVFSVGDTPAKTYRSNTEHTNSKFDLQAYRGELRFNMRRKISILEHKPFMKKFFGSAQKNVSKRKIFINIPSPSRERDMYDTLVSTPNVSFPRRSSQ